MFDGVTLINARIGRKTYFTTDVGGVLELYPSARTIVRFDAGDTIIRYGPHFEYDPLNFPQLIRFPAKVKHNFQFTAGVGFRLGHSTAPMVSKADNARNAAARFEAGVQFTSLSVNQPTAPCPEICLQGGEPRPITEPGLGGRFTFNLTDNVALEAEGNYYTRDNRGHMFQSQFGVKAGKRFRRFGVFAKARPGFVDFTKVTQLVGTRTVPFGDRQLIIGDFRVGAKEYFSTDIGGVIEFYVSRRVLTRMDFGDTIIHYSERAVAGFSTSNTIVRSPPETKHNFQYTAGLGFRF